jgi:hypothetical protein
MDSIHGRRCLKMGLIVAPSCNDCHGVHNIKRSVDRDSPINHANVAKTCGKCHVGVEETYDQSIHGQLLAKGDRAGRSARTATPRMRSSIRRATISKPSATSAAANATDRLEHYRDTYHGKAMALGKPNVAPEVAACYDCHGYHDVLPPSNPASHLSKTNILATCQQCHPGATIKFTEYRPHANPLDGRIIPAPRGVSGDDRPAHRHVRLLRPAHPRLAGARGLSLPARHENVPRSQDQNAGRTTNGSRASCRSSASCISWS